MSALMALPNGGSAEVVESDGVHVAVLSSVPSPPGSTLAGSLTIDEVASPDQPPLRIKVRGCRRTQEHGERPFRIEGRFVDITRDQRAAIVRVLPAAK